MKKTKLMLSILIAGILLFAMSVTAKAATLTTSETPSSVESGSNFKVVLKADEKLAGIQGHILWDSDLITMTGKGTEGVLITPDYADKEGAFIYQNFSPTLDTVELEMKAGTVTEDTVVELSLKNLKLTTDNNPAQKIDDKTITITIKPKTDSDNESKDITVNTTEVNLTIGKTQTITATGNGKLTWKSSNEKVATVDEDGKITAVGAGETTITITDESGKNKTIKVKVTTGASSVEKDDTVINKNLAKTGESTVLLVAIAIITVVLIVTGIKFKKVSKLFVMLPLLVAVSFAGKTVNAEGINGTTYDDKAIIGILADHPDLSNIENPTGISPNVSFVQWDSTEEKENFISFNEFPTGMFSQMTAVKDHTTGESKSKDVALATGDVIETYGIKGEVGFTNTIVLFGDANGDGVISDLSDINVIVNDYLKIDIANGANRVAANLYVDSEEDAETCALDVFDIRRMQLKFTNKLADPTLVNDISVFQDEYEDSEDIVITPSVGEAGEDLYITLNDVVGLSANKDVVWSVDNENVVTLSDIHGAEYTCLVEPKSVGKAVITATDENGKTGTFNITVGTKAVLFSTGTELTVEEGYSTSIKISTDGGETWVSGDNAQSWSSEDANIVTVDQNGRIEAKSVGTTKIKAITPITSGIAFYSINVTVNALEPFEIKYGEEDKDIDIALNVNSNKKIHFDKYTGLIYDENADEGIIDWKTTDDNCTFIISSSDIEGNTRLVANQNGSESKVYLNITVEEQPTQVAYGNTDTEICLDMDINSEKRLIFNSVTNLSLADGFDEIVEIEPIYGENSYKEFNIKSSGNEGTTRLIATNRSNTNKVYIDIYVSENRIIAHKPIIYLYPEEETNLTVTLGYEDQLTCTYPKYNGGWNVTASPDGTLIDNKTGKKLYSLYWEGGDCKVPNESEGFVVKGEDVADFLDEKLEILGLNYKEREEFILYWLPKMEANKYNFVRFATAEEINSYMPLSFSVEPDSVIRVLMQFKSLDEYKEVKEQELVTPERKGFVAVEWGGTELTK